MSPRARRERKIITVLFADLVGFTARSETLDPEDVEAILIPFHARLRSELERHGGTVEKFIGDAVMAVFGVPTAHEDDPERAVRAALAIRDWIREQADFEVRIAVTTGEALVSLEPSPGAERGLVAGDVVNTASRLQAAAPVNGILVGETTYRATSRVIRYRGAEAVDAKGKTEPVQVWEPVEARSRFGADVTRGVQTPLVGREHELELLVNTLTRVRRERATQLVTLTGVPGIGKSRLVYELFATVEADPELIYWRQGRCLPYGEGVTFWALGEILKAHAGIMEGEPDELVLEKLRSVVDEAVPESGEAEWVVRQLRPLVGLGEAAGDEASDELRTESFAAWRRFFEGLAELDPLVLVFEDLHWADDGLLEFVDHLVDWAASVPILVVATARPELLSRRPDWGGGKPNATTVSLSPLSEQETATLVHRLLDRVVLPADVHTALLDRAGGNPLYAEEFARIALERGALTDGAAELPLPESVQGLIAARLDTLTDEEKSLLQDASVLGKVFWVGAAAALAGAQEPAAVEQRLHALERKQFVRRERRSSVEGDTQYAFVHGLVREVAYGQIPRAARAEKHRRAATWIESLGRPEDQAELLAHHYLSALELAQAAGQDVGDLEEPVRLALREAGDRAASLASYEQAKRHYNRALELWPDGGPDRARLQLAAARVTFHSIETNHEELTAARDALLAAGDRAAAAEAESLAASAFWVLGRGEDVRRRADTAAELAEGLPASAAKAAVYANLCRLHWLGGRAELAFRLGREALRIADELGLPWVRAVVLTSFGTHHATHGDPHGLDELEEAIRLFEEVNSPSAQRAYNNLADTLYRLGELGRAGEAGVRMREAGARFAKREWFRWSDSHELRVLYNSGAWDEALTIADRWIADVDAGNDHYLEALWRVIRARIRAARGDLAGAAEDAAKSVASGRRIADAQVLVPTLAYAARLRWSAGDHEAGSLALESAELIDDTVGLADDWWPDIAIVLGGLDREDALSEAAAALTTRSPWYDAGAALGRHEPAEAAEIFKAMGALPWEAEARLQVAKDGLDAELPSAIEFFRRVGASAYLADAEDLAKTRSA